MKIEILFLGKTKDSFIQQGIDEYSSRLKHYTNLSIKIIKYKARNQRNEAKTIIDEGKLLLQNCAKNSLKCVLDSRGKQFSSESFSEKISEFEQRGVKAITIIIGGPLGLSEEVRKAADLVLSLSKMTFTHDMIRMLIVEQLYRAYTIKAGEKYHK